MPNPKINPLKRSGEAGEEKPATTSVPERSKNPFASMPRCLAKTRSGTPCQRVGSARNGRCKLHGGRAGAPSGKRNGKWRHGGETKQAKAQRKALRALIRDAQELLGGSE